MKRTLTAAAAVGFLAAGLVAGCPPHTATPAIPPSPTPAPPIGPRQCADGTWPAATGPGACSYHGGVRGGGRG